MILLIFYNLAYITYNIEDIIKHSLYNFDFNHETPGHANLHLTEKMVWK
jgi:hypothetical protein